MARYRVAPTKTSLFKTKRDQAFAREGHQLLVQKRDILVAELMGLIDAAVEAQKKVDAAVCEAYAVLCEAVVRMGRLPVSAAARAVTMSADISVGRRDIVGVHVPVIRVAFAEHAPYCSVRETSLWLDEAMKAFQRVLKLLGLMAEHKISLMRIAAEVRKTVRRVNALEQIYLPDYEDTIKYINDVLDEQGREAFFVLKLVKSRIDRRFFSGN